MSRRHSYRALQPACGKVRYATEELAHDALVSAQRDAQLRPRAKVEQRSYYCEACRGHHLTSMSLERAYERGVIPRQTEWSL